MFEQGEIIELDNNLEYVVMAVTEYKGDSYVFLLSNFKPVDVMFAKQIPTEEQVELTIVEDRETKEALLEIFQDTIKTSLSETKADE